MAKNGNNKNMGLLEQDLDSMETLPSMYDEMEELEETYKPVGRLNVPQETINALAEQGYTVRWVRVYASGSNGQLDMKNIRQKEQEGFKFIPREEVKGLQESMSSYFGAAVNEGDFGLYIIGDLALAKIPTVKLQAKRNWLDTESRKKTVAVMHDLRKDSLLPDKTHGEVFSVQRQQVAEKRPKRVTSDFGE